MNQNGNPLANITNMMSQFQQFKTGFRGNAQQEVQKLLNSGQMTQQQFNQLQSMATQWQSFLK